MDNMVQLHCEAGDHTWERESQRGRRPRSCPKHSEIPATSVKTRVQAEVSLPAWLEPYPGIDAVPGSDESMLKYIAERIQGADSDGYVVVSGRREEVDVPLLLKRGQDILRPRGTSAWQVKAEPIEETI